MTNPTDKIRIALEQSMDIESTAEIHEALTALTALEQPVDVEGLKKELVFDDNMNNPSHQRGWNDCVDHLTQRGLINGGWRDISSAPRDGTYLLGYSDQEWPVIFKWHHCIRDPMGNIYEHEDWSRMNGAGASMFNTPTHWMPLTQPPEQSE